MCPQLLSAETEADAWDGQRQGRLAVAQGAVQTAAAELRSHLSFAEEVPATLCDLSELMGSITQDA